MAAENRAAERTVEESADGGELFNIGQVLDLLRADFPGLISIPKIRLLEQDGLITPHRTASGYRKFSHRDVERIRYVLRMQRDHYLPKKVIAEHLDAMDRGLEPPEAAPVVPTVPTVSLASDGTPSADSFRRTDNLRLSRKELVKIAEVSDELLRELEDARLITAVRGYYDSDALVIAQTAKELAEFGIEPRHLRGMKAAADREVGLVQQIVAPQLRTNDPAARARAEETAAEVAALSVRLHATLIKAGLKRP
ncbi:MAG: transcriptional regulator FtsR [Nocardioides sp.]